MSASHLVPMVIEQTSLGERSFDIYSRLLKDRIVVLGVPVDQAIGNAGKSSISSRLDCSSISAMPAVPPKFPSIWNGGCASNMLG